MKKQPFLEFLCEVMLHSPSGKELYRGQRDIRKAEGNDVLGFLDVRNPRYQSEVNFLLKHCKRKCQCLSSQNKLFAFHKIRSSCSIKRCR